MRAAGYRHEEKVSRQDVEKFEVDWFEGKEKSVHWTWEGKNSHSKHGIDASIEAHSRRWLSRKNAI